MINFNIKNFLKEYQFFIILNKNLKNLYDLFFTSIFCFILYLLPNISSLFLSKNNRGTPEIKNKFLNTNNFYDDWIFDHDFQIILDEINIIVNPDTLLGNIINKNLPSFFINSTKTPLSTFPNAYGATADNYVYKKMNKMGVRPIFFASSFSHFDEDSIRIHKTNSKLLTEDKLNNFYFKSGLRFKCLDNVSSGSAINTIVTLSRIANKVNIYGWDSYLNKNISSMNKLEALFSLMSKPKNNDTKRFYYIAPNLFNFLYAFKIKNSDNIKINGNLSGIDKHHYLVKKIEKIIYI